MAWARLSASGPRRWLGELGFDGAVGREVGDDGGAELVEGVAILPGHAGDLAGETVTGGVEARGLFAAAVAGPVEC